jgi:dephospho-CoA kinase
MPIALILFGGICSGKTTFAETIEGRYGFTVISKDRCIYESDL